MPRIAITVSLVDDRNRPLRSETWSPLGYEDLGNSELFVAGETLVNDSEINLLERLRTSIDRSLLTFARRERRRWSGRGLAEVESQTDADLIHQVQYLGEFSEPEPEPEPEPYIVPRREPIMQIPIPSIGSALTEDQRMALIAEQPMVEAPLMHDMPQRPKRTRPIKRVSRYKRVPVI